MDLSVIRAEIAEQADNLPRTLRDVLAWLACVYDDLYEVGEVERAQTGADVLRLIRRNYRTGDCVAFAIAVYLRTGWQIYELRDRAYPFGYHVFVRTRWGAPSTLPDTRPCPG